MNVRNLRDRWKKSEGWVGDEMGGRERGEGIDIGLGKSKTTLTLSHCDVEDGGTRNPKSSLSSSNDSLPGSFAPLPKSVLKKTSTVGRVVDKKGQPLSGCKYHGKSGRGVHFKEVHS